MQPNLEDRCARLLAELGLVGAGTPLRVRPLTGGVASDIARVTLPGRELCVKFALGKLKVAEDWHAPVHRNRAEYAWLAFARTVSPANAPALYGWSERLQGFAMEYLGGEDVRLWKSALLAGRPCRGVAERVAALLGRLHAASAAPGFDRAPFANRDDFRALRLEPYLTFTASRHPTLAGRLAVLADALYRADAVLVHGDVSPKNILLRRGEPVLLDAECATMGDASFDPAFCLNHLILKSFHMPELGPELHGEAAAFWRAYASHVTWEDAAALEARVATLVPALMLARIDGKSPVEYLDAATRAAVRDAAVPRIAAPDPTIEALLNGLKTERATP